MTYPARVLGKRSRATTQALLLRRLGVRDRHCTESQRGGPPGG